MQLVCIYSCLTALVLTLSLAPRTHSGSLAPAGLGSRPQAEDQAQGLQNAWWGSLASVLIGAGVSGNWADGG